MHPFTNRRAILTVATHAALFCTALMIAFGPLTPPAGIVTGTAKPLSEVEPRIAITATNTPGDADSLFKITQPGSYYLTGNVTGVTAKHGVEIAASGVTLDLNGFDLVGVSGSLDGVTVATTGLSNIAVLNGSLRSWGGEGVDLGNSSPVGCRFRGLTSSANAGAGLRIGPSGTVDDCRALGNSGNGIIASSGASILHCVMNDNSSSGFSGSINSLVGGCIAYNNGGTGFGLSSGCTVNGCTAVANTVSGFSLGTGSTITACTARSNTASGISANSSSTVADCTASSNGGNGIGCSSSCHIRANNCAGNGQDSGSNIVATGSNNRIEGNNCGAAPRGIYAPNAGNVIVRNTCTGNTTNWDIAANNVVGPILNRTAPGSAAVSGDAAPSSLGSTDANANYTF